MKHDAEISVVVPMYNAEKYVGQCVDSILSQDFEEYEVILVDDCSTDGSLALCKEAYGKDPKVQILRLGKNMGPGAARNAGIYMSRGKFITFVDADDVLMPNALSLMRDVALQTDAEVVVGNTHFRSMEEGGSVIRPGSALTVISPAQKDFCKERLHVLPSCSERELLVESVYQTLSIASYTWAKLYSRDFLVRHQLRFPDQGVWAEDLLFMLPVLMKADPYVVMTEPFYVYRTHSGSVSRKEKTAEHMGVMVKGLVLGLRYFDQFAGDDFFKDSSKTLDSIKKYYLLRGMFQENKGVFKTNVPFGGEMDRIIEDELRRYFGQDAASVKLLYYMANTYFANLVDLQDENARLKEMLRNGGQENGGTPPAD